MPRSVELKAAQSATRKSAKSKRGGARPNSGGARPGAGRPPGSRSKLVVQAVEAARTSGQLPHEFLLDVSRGVPVLIKGRWYHPNFDQRRDAAKAAAPYFAPRLASHEVTGAGGKDLIPEITDEVTVDGARRFGFVMMRGLQIKKQKQQQQPATGGKQ